MRAMTALSPIAPRGDNNITYRIHSNARTTPVVGRASHQSSLLWATLADQYGVTALSLSLIHISEPTRQAESRMPSSA